MKKVFLFIPFYLLAFSMMAQPPKGPANSGMIFGDTTTAAGAVNAGELATVASTKPDGEIKVKGKVVAVCKMMGCWLKMQTPDGTVMIKMKDESFFVPLEINDKIVVAKGIAEIKETSVEELRHYGVDAGKSKEEIAAIKTPKREVIMEATGILVL